MSAVSVLLMSIVSRVIVKLGTCVLENMYDIFINQEVVK